MNLFNSGEFILHSGLKSSFKIDADSLTNEDITTLAMIIKNNIPPFAWVEGVPTGGLKLADALQPFACPNDTIMGLICDDVLTTGGSMETQRGFRHPVMGIVLFNRMPMGEETPPWVKSVWRWGL